MSSSDPARSLSLFDLLCLGVNAIVGSGIYLFPGMLAALLGPASFLAFMVAGAISLLVAFCFAEASASFDRSGGPYVYARSAFGGKTGYLVGWTCWAAALVSWAAVTHGLVDQLTLLFPALKDHAVALRILPLLGVFTFAAVNYFGIKPGAVVNDVLTVAKLLPLFALTIGGLYRFDARRLSPFAPRGLTQLPRATFITFFAYQGFEVVPVPAGESENPRRNVPYAVVGSLLGSTLLYIVIQIAAVASTPGIAGSSYPLTMMGQAIWGSAGAAVVTLGGSISMAGFCAGVALASPRYLEALAADGYLPNSLARRHARYGTPHIAILVTTTLAALLVSMLDFSKLVDLSVLTVAVQYISTSAAIPFLRRQQTAPPTGRTFRLPGGPTLPIVSLLVVVALVGLQISEQKDAQTMFIALGALIGVGVVSAAGWRLARGA